MLKLVFLSICATVCYGRSVVTDCGPADAAIKFTTIDIEPYPVNIRGKIQVKADVETVSQLSSQARLSIVIRKTNFDGSFTWEVPCTDIGWIGAETTGITGFLGSCDYKGSCDFPLIKSWVSKQNCPDFFAEYKIPCQCPFPPQKLTTNGYVEIDLADFNDRLPAWLAEGGYIVNAKLKDPAQNDKMIGCLEMNLEVSAAKPCPEVLKKLNACPK